MDLIDLTIFPREKDLGGFTVRRILPYMKRRMVGPFIFLDHMGPAQFAANHGIDVRPHPHIGLATVTYLFEGEIIHRDSLGSNQAIRPGDVNWMTAGRGIAHSERTAVNERSRPHNVHGLQSWVALPKEYEELPPQFFHYNASKLPEFTIGKAAVKLIAGRAFKHESPVSIHSPLFYAEAILPAGARLTLPNEYRERALYLVEGQLKIGNIIIRSVTMPVFNAGETITITAELPSRIMLLGGEPLAEQRFIDWNFVSSSHERIEEAKADWANGKFPKIPGDDKEFIPLPEQPKPGTIL